MDDQLPSPPGSPGGGSAVTSSNMTTKQYILVNLSKFIVEIVGTAVIGVFYLLMGDQQAGILLGGWVVTLFGVAISGAHFNPAITLVFMFRRSTTSSFGKRRLLGVMYIVAQFLGGILAATSAIFILEKSPCHKVAVSPIVDYDGDNKNIAAILSEILGTFFYVFLFMLCTDKKTQFSQDKVINCFIIASAYCASRLLAGGTLVTGLNRSQIDQAKYDADGTCEDLHIPGVQTVFFKQTGPLLNPALAFGQMLDSFQFSHIIQYVLCPFAGAAIALIFYEFVFVKSQEYLNSDADANSSLHDGIDASPPQKKRQVNEDDDAAALSD